MTSPPLALRLTLTPTGIRILARGDIHAGNAHLLSNVVVGALRRYPTPRLELDLTLVDHLDHAGNCAIDDSRREAERRGVYFALTGPSDHHEALHNEHAGDLIGPIRHRPARRLRPLPTGVICLDRSAYRH